MKRFGNGDEDDVVHPFSSGEKYPDEEMWTRIIEYAEKNRRLTWPEALIIVSILAFISFFFWLLWG